MDVPKLAGDNNIAVAVVKGVQPVVVCQCVASADVSRCGSVPGARPDIRRSLTGPAR